MANQIADICIVGAGHVGGILAKQLGQAGLRVVALERGPSVTLADYAARDAVKFIVRLSELDWVRHEPITFRNRSDETASVRPGITSSVGGQTLHWTGEAARFLPGDFKVFTNEIASGLAEQAGADLTGYDIVDWPIAYDDLEPYYTRFEWEFGVSGAGGTNPFAGPYSRALPLPPLRTSAKDVLFGTAARKLGYSPWQSAAGILSQDYQPPAPFDTTIPARSGCVYCGHCNGYGCHVNAKDAALYTVIPAALATGNVELRTGCKVFTINTDDSGQVTGVVYFDPEHQIQVQQARVVILAGYVFENTRLLLLSGIANSSGMVGKGLAGHGDINVHGVLDDYIVNGFIGPNSGNLHFDDLNGNNFDHTGLGFIRGANFSSSGTATPIQELEAIPPDLPTWGTEFKEFLVRSYTRQVGVLVRPETLPHQENYIDLDPTVRDEWGVPVPRLTFSFHQNERAIGRYMADIGQQIVRAMGASTLWMQGPGAAPTRHVGGTRMGSDSTISVVNDKQQSHDVPNLFVAGASVFPTLTGYPATATISALAYRTAEYIIQQHDWFK